jgi:hypothetical protein
MTSIANRTTDARRRLGEIQRPIFGCWPLRQSIFSKVLFGLDCLALRLGKARQECCLSKATVRVLKALLESSPAAGFAFVPLPAELRFLCRE